LKTKRFNALPRPRAGLTTSAVPQAETIFPSFLTSYLPMWSPTTKSPKGSSSNFSGKGILFLGKIENQIRHFEKGKTLKPIMFFEKCNFLKEKWMFLYLE
jgi:hypothetical protein